MAEEFADKRKEVGVVGILIQNLADGEGNVIIKIRIGFAIDSDISSPRSGKRKGDDARVVACDDNGIRIAFDMKILIGDIGVVVFSEERALNGHFCRV